MRSSGKNAGNSDAEGLSSAIEEQRAYLLRFAMFHLRDPSRAEDAVQETLIAALQHRGQFAGRSGFRTWLTAILKHKIVDQVRRNERYAPLDAAEPGAADGTDGVPNPFSASGRWAEKPAPWQLPEQALESMQFWRVYEKCCEAMPRRHALVFSMREVMEMTSEEICKELGISASNLHVILFRARLRLRECMSRHWFGQQHA
jgi:RNA polymerase sigma-70 factor (ECF subfamily)